MAYNNQVPPQNLDAEKAVLGCMMMNRQAYEQVSALLKVDDFYSTKNSMVYQAIIDFKQENYGNELDILTLTDFLQKKGILEICGGVDYISSLTSEVPTTTNVMYYANVVKNNSTRRKLLSISSQLKDNVFDDSVELNAAIDTLEKDIMGIATDTGAKNFSAVKDLVLSSITGFEMRMNGGNLDGVPSGYKDLDNIIGCFRKAEFSIIAARPSVGKTAFALSIASNIAIRQKRKVGFFSLEMSGISLADRLLSAESGVNFKFIRNGQAPTTEKNKVFKAAEELYELDTLWIQDTPNMPLYDLRTQARRMVMEKGVEIIFIDYIGLIQSNLKNAERHEQIGEISRSLKQLARELNIPIVVLCQVGRQGEGQEPTLANLRDSGSIEQDADLVIILHKERRYENLTQDPDEPQPEVPYSPVQKIKVIIAKQRNGEVGWLYMGLRSSVVRFENYEEEQ